MKKVWIIEFDNGESYEDHHTEAMMVVKTRAQAHALTSRLNAWMTEQRKAGSTTLRRGESLQGKSFTLWLRRKLAHDNGIPVAYISTTVADDVSLYLRWSGGSFECHPIPAL